MTLCTACSVLCPLSKIHMGKLCTEFLRFFFSVEISCIDWNAFIRFMPGCLLSASSSSPLSGYPTPPVDVFFTDDLLWISNLQCSDCYRQQQCFSRAVKAELPLHCLRVWHLHSLLLSVYRRKSGLMSVSGNLTKQSVALNMRVILVEMVICSICRRGGKNTGG